MADLVNKYRDPSQHGLINYLNLHRHIEALLSRNEPQIVGHSNQSNQSAFKVPVCYNLFKKCFSFFI